MSTVRSLLSSAGVVFALMTGTAASATVITFSALSGSNGDTFTSYSESGYTVTKDSGSGCKALQFGSPVPSVFGGPICDNGTSGVFSITGSGLFHFDSIDFSANGGGMDYTIEGLLGGSTIWTQAASQAGPNGVFLPVAGTSGLSVDSLRLSFSTEGTSWNFDNIGLSTGQAVPEPGSFALAGLALLGLASARRRHAA